jgi:hypothetical protein
VISERLRLSRADVNPERDFFLLAVLGADLHFRGSAQKQSP